MASAPRLTSVRDTGNSLPASCDSSRARSLPIAFRPSLSLRSAMARRSGFSDQSVVSSAVRAVSTARFTSSEVALMARYTSSPLTGLRISRGWPESLPVHSPAMKFLYVVTSVAIATESSIGLALASAGARRLHRFGQGQAQQAEAVAQHLLDARHERQPELARRLIRLLEHGAGGVELAELLRQLVDVGGHGHRRPLLRRPRYLTREIRHGHHERALDGGESAEC